MKHILYFIITFMASTAFDSFAYALYKDLNGYRAGDNLGMYRISSTPNYAFQDTSLYDFSSCTIGEKHTIKYAVYKDSLISAYESRSVTLYDMRSDTIISVAFRKPGLNMNYARPEMTMIYPLESGKSASGYFFSEGKDGTLEYVRHAGKNMVSAMSETATIITPDKDTINDILVVTYIRNATTIMSQDFSKSYLRNHNTEILSNDSIEKHLTTDSISHCIMRRSWYALGYRYPIIDIRQYNVYHHGKVTDTTTIALYYSRDSQENEIANDPENETIRSILKYPSVDNKNQVMDIQAKSMAGNLFKINTINSEIDISSDDNMKQKSVENTLHVAESCDLYPRVVHNSTILSYSTTAGNDAEIYIYTASGSLMWQKTIASLDSSGTIECYTAELVPGDYLLTCRIGKQRYSFKIVKE